MTTRDTTATAALKGLAALRARVRARRQRALQAPLAFSREKKLLLGALGMVVALPFPMNEPRPDGVVSWAALLLFVGAVTIFMVRTWQGREPRVPVWGMNVAGLLYLPIFLFRLRTIGPTHIARPMVELLLFVLVMRFYGMRREREKWQIAMLLFFLFIAAMATSVHPLILLYLGVALTLWLVLMLRFLQLHLEETYPIVVPGSRLRPYRLVAAFGALTLVGAVPFFTMLPRLRQPYIMGGGAGRIGYATGFRDEVTLDVVGSVRENPAVALRMKADDPTFRPPSLLRGTTYDELRDNKWQRSHSRQDLMSPQSTNLFRLAPGKVEAKIRIWLEPIDTRSLILPIETLSVELSQRLYQDIAGGVLMLQPLREVLEYRVGVSSRPVYRAATPLLDDPREPTLDRGGITPRIDDLARRLAEGFPPEESPAHRIQQYLAHNMTYTLDFLGRDAENPIEDFLFRYRSGHCEYFATAMILMLRSAGIPARLATGFMGSEFNPLENYYIVRQSNAHAWVEAYLPENGWSTFDPTPPAGRPPVELQPTVRLVLRQTWDYLEFRWDRYVMSYGFFDQVGFLLRLRDLMASIGKRQGYGGFSVQGDLPTTSFDGGEEAGEWRMSGPIVLLLIVAALVVVGLALFWRARFSLPIATRSYQALRAAAARRDPAIGAATGPIALRRWLEQQLPAAQDAGAGLIELYLLESYRGARLSRGQAAAVRRDLRQVRKLLRRRRPVAGPQAGR